MTEPTKKLQTDIFANDIDGNAYGIMAAFERQAKKEGWTKEEIRAVMTEAQDGDYSHLIQTFMRYID